MKISTNYFKTFLEDLSIIKECELTNKNEYIVKLENGAEFSFSLVIAEQGYPKQVKDSISKIKSNKYHVILAPYISEQTARICDNAGVGYLDMSGNCVISYESLYVEIKGNKNENVSKRGLKSIYERSSVVSSIILRTMLSDVKRAWKMKDLACDANCSIGQVAKVKDFLLNQAYVEHTSSGIVITEPKAIMRDWSEVYNNSDNESNTFYSLDDVSLIESKIAKMKDEIGIECILTGFSGGARYQPVVRYQKVHAYLDEFNMKKAIEYLGLKEVESGANVLLIVPYHDCVKHESSVQKDNVVASPVQLYLDCMSLKGRGEEMAEAILEREICK